MERWKEPAPERETVKQNRDTYTRLLAPQHLTYNHFSEHRQIEGYRQDMSHPDFVGSDRLFKLETIYGKIQMGYDPQRGEAFLFAGIKTSILDHAPSRHQRELREEDSFRQTKSGNQNVALVSRRQADTTVMLYKKESRQWSMESVAPYLGRVNMEALLKTMPFLDTRREAGQLAEARQEKKEQEGRLRALMARGEYAGMAAVRRREHELLLKQDFLQALLRRKESQSLMFFRRLNMAYDWQKHEMFAFYRNRLHRQGPDAAESDVIGNRVDEREDDE